MYITKSVDFHLKMGDIVVNCGDIMASHVGDVQDGCKFRADDCD